MPRLDRNEILGKLGGVETILAHSDADGVTSAYLLARTIEDARVYFPKRFREFRWEGVAGDVLVDKVPEEGYTGLVIDHHPDHPEEPEYWLYWGSVPASLLVYDLVADKLPEEEHWKLIPGLVGDGRAEIIPVSFWSRYPELLENIVTVRKYRGSTYLYSSPVWFLLSSPLNAACRTGKSQLALERLAIAKSPLDLVFDQKLQEEKTRFTKELDRVRSESRAIQIGNCVLVWMVSSPYKVEGILATELWEEKKITSIVINEQRRSGSIRGVLADYLKTRLVTKWNIGGHAGFAGLDLEGIDMEEVVKALIKDLRRIF